MTREEAREAIKEAYGNSEYTDEIIKALEQEPSEGYWFDRGSLSCRCSNCGCKSNKESAYCPNCGVKMVNPQKSEEI